jgi:hypothetical protein
MEGGAVAIPSSDAAMDARIAYSRYQHYSFNHVLRMCTVVL